MFTQRIRPPPVMDGAKIMGMITVRELIRAIRKGDEDEMKRFPGAIFNAPSRPFIMTDKTIFSQLLRGCILRNLYLAFKHEYHYFDIFI